MLSITTRNVNDAFSVGMYYLRQRGVPSASRNGPVLEYPDPVSIKYTRPLERVLFNRARDINPFLHFFEPLWILAGKADVEFLANIVPRFREYSDNSVTFYGAYGDRLRYAQSSVSRAPYIDQLDEAVRILSDNHEDRRVVLQIRRPEDILYRGKDQPCNISVAVKVRDNKLNIHVFNRSNDFIWGLAGANMPQFSVLQEYLAGRIGVEVGVYHQTTDNMHVYTQNPQWDKLKDLVPAQDDDPYLLGRVSPYRLFNESPALFERDLHVFFDNKAGKVYKSLFFREVVEPMWATFQAHKANRTGLQAVEQVAASDWRAVTRAWLEARE